MSAAGVSSVLELVTAALMLVLTVLVGAIGWYLRQYIISEVEKNSALREYLLGTDVERDNGMLDEMQEMHREVARDHREVSHRLDYLSAYLEEIADAVESDVEEPDFPEHREEPDASDYGITDD